MNDSPTLATLFERVRIFLADGDFVKADEYCERILDMEPTNWEAYYYKFLAALNLKNEDMLSAVSIPFGNVPVFHKLTQYAPKDVMDRLAAIEAANYSRLMEAKFAEAQNLEKVAHTAFDFAKAAVAYEALGSYRNASAHAIACRTRSSQLAAKNHQKVKKAIITLTVVVVAIYILISIITAIYQNSPGASYTYEDTEGGIIILQAKNQDITTLKIPEKIDGKPVLYIGFSAFAECKKLKKVVLPDTLVAIHGYAFRDCTSLREIQFPTSGSLTSIGERAFYNCDSLKVVHIPEGVTTLGQWAFAHITYIEEMVIPSTVTEMNAPFYESCVESLTMPNILNYYGSREMPLGLARLVLTKSEKTTLGTGFIELPFLKSIVLPEGITIIGKGYFTGHSHIESITLSEGIKIIGDDTFADCTSLKEVILPDSLTEIYTHAFRNCTALERITIPEGISRIQEYAFAGCYALTIYCEKDFDDPNGTLYDYKWDHVFSGSNDKVKVVYGYKEE